MAGAGGGVARSSSSLTAALVPSPAAVSVAPGPASTPAAAVATSVPAQSQAAAPQSFVYEHNKTYAVLDTCHVDRAPRAQTTHDAARSVT